MFNVWYFSIVEYKDGSLGNNIINYVLSKITKQLLNWKSTYDSILDWKLINDVWFFFFSDMVSTENDTASWSYSSRRNSRKAFIRLLFEKGKTVKIISQICCKQNSWIYHNDSMPRMARSTWTLWCLDLPKFSFPENS